MIYLFIYIIISCWDNGVLHALREAADVLGVLGGAGGGAD